jgi:hypothetical protein
MKFNKQLSTILEDMAHGRLRPAIIITARGVEIKADHARWIKGRNDKIFLAVGIGPAIRSSKPKNKNWNYGILSRARDFFAPPRFEAISDTDSQGNYVTRCATCGLYPRHHELGHPYACNNYTPGNKYDAHKKLIKTRRFNKILTIHKENVRSLRWLDQ